MGHYPKILYPPDFDPWEFADFPNVGRANILVEVSSIKTAKIWFLDQAAIERDLREIDRFGLECLYLQNLVVVSKLTREKIESSVKQLFENGQLERFSDRNTQAG